MLLLFVFFSETIAQKTTQLNQPVQPLSQPLVGIEALKDTASFYYNSKDYKRAFSFYKQIQNEYSGRSVDSTAKYYDMALNAMEKYSMLDEKAIKAFLYKYQEQINNRDIVGDLYLLCFITSTNYNLPSVYQNKDLVIAFLKEIKLGKKLQYEIYIALAAWYSKQENCDEADKYINNAHEIIVHSNFKNDRIYGLFCYNAAVVYINCNQLYLAKEKLSQSIPLLSKVYPPHHNMIGQLYNALGVLNQQLGYTSESIRDFDKSYNIFKANGFRHGMALASSNQSTSALYLGMIEQSDILNEQYFKSFSPVESRPSDELSKYWASKSINYTFENRYKESDSLLKLAMNEMLQLYNEDDIDVINTYSQWGANKKDEGKYADAIGYYDKVIKSFKKLGSLNLSYWKAVLGKAQCLTKLGNYTEARQLYNAYMVEVKKEYLPSYINELSYTNGMIETYQIEKNNRKVIEIAEPLLIKYVLSNENKNRIPSIQELELSVHYIEALLIDKPTKSVLNKIFNLILVENKRLSNQLFSIQNPNDFEANRRAVFSLNALGCKAVSLLYQEDANPELFKDFFLFSDQAYTGQISQNENIKDILIKKFNDSTAYNQLISIREEAKYLESFASQSAIKDVHDLKRYEEFLPKIEAWKKAYPAYLSLLQGQDYAQTSQLLHFLKNQKCSLLSISIIGNKYVAYLISNSRLSTFEIGDKKEVDSLIDQCTYAMANRLENNNALGELSKRLAVNIEKISGNRLIVIPTGNFWNLNIEPLRMSDNRLVIDRFEIQYATTIPKVVTASDKKRIPMTVVVPGFEKMNKQQDIATLDSDAEVLTATPWSIQTGKILVQKYNATSLLNENATKGNVLRAMKSSGTLHFSTHATFNVHRPQLNTLFMYEAKNNLTAADIYGHRLNAELVTLIGCETGLGKMQATEGNKSIANAFLFSGANFVIQSLWKIDDEQSNVIIRDFYLKYFDHQSIASSLRSVKLNYIEKSRGPLAVPYYWAGLITIGNQVEDPFHDYWFWRIVGLVTLGLIILIWSKKRKRFYS